ncbi:MAG: hypothetical protein JWP04_2950, partial [Belnapia sp.]|nr:hypothetical protein [Belnapia sp.]
MILDRRCLLLVLAAPVSAFAQPSTNQPSSDQPSGKVTGPRGSDLWFDPTQLPSFTGTVERYLPNPRGETDALVFREGPQIVFPPDVADGVRAAAPAGRPLIVWGIRARSAPVITMLAFAPSTEVTPVVVERFYWHLTGRQAIDGAAALTLEGVVRQPYYTPQGEVAGAILEDGSVVLLPAGTAEPFRDLLKPGQKLAAAGPGRAGDAGLALLATQIGAEPGAMRPV